MDLRVSWAVLALTALGLAGCADDGGTADVAPEFDDLGLEATATTGVIRGVVVDQAVRPVAGATVKEVATGATTVTSDLGLFGFADLAPGTYFLEVTRLGFFAVQQSVDVVADVAEPPILKVVLVADVGYLPYAVLQTYDGWIECTTSVLVTCGAPNTLEPIFCAGFDPFPPICYGNLTNDRFTWNFYNEPNMTWLQTEMSWESSQALSPELTLEMETLGEGCEDDDYYFNESGPTPIVWHANATVLEDTDMIFGPECPVYYSVFSGGVAGTPAGVTLQQSFKSFSTAFYQYEPPEGWAFVLDGAVPPPPI